MATPWVRGACCLSILVLPFAASWLARSSDTEVGGEAGASDAPGPVLVDEVPRGGDGRLLEPGPARYTSDFGACPPDNGEVCGKLDKMDDAIERCEVYERVACRPDCHGYETRRYTCDPRDRKGWRLSETHAAACQCAPQKPPVELAECTTRYVNVRPSERSLTDGCSLGLNCPGEVVWVQCDGENDGTQTSLCECWREGRRVQQLSSLGEAPDACFAAAAACVKQ